MKQARDLQLRWLTDHLSHLEKTRIAINNRLMAIRAGGELPLPELIDQQAFMDVVMAEEKRATKRLETAMQDHPYGPFVANVPGLGYKTIGRLVGIVGDPYWHPEHDRPRTVSELWAYCGLNPTAPPAMRGMTQQDARARGNRQARAMLYVISSVVIRYDNVYREVYDKRRAHTIERIHVTNCRNTIVPRAHAPAGSNGCATTAHPEWGATGSPWRKGHQHSDGLRVVAKTLLKDLWLYGRRQDT